MNVWERRHRWRYGAAGYVKNTKVERVIIWTVGIGSDTKRILACMRKEGRGGTGQ